MSTIHKSFHNYAHLLWFEIQEKIIDDDMAKLDKNYCHLLGINGIVLDPFIGSGTTAVAAQKLDCNYIGIELNPEYIQLANNRIKEGI